MNVGPAGRIDLTLIFHRLRDGALGVGVFSLHAGLFLLTVLSLFLWNLITDPSDMGVPAPRLMIPWGVLVLIHASIVAAFSVAREVFAPEESVWAPTPPARTAASSPQPTAARSVDVAPPRPTSRFRPTGSTSLEDAREASQDSVAGALRHPMQTIRQATGAFRRDTTEPKPRAEARPPGWRTEPGAPMSDVERRELGSRQLANWRGEKGSADRMSPSHAPAADPARQGAGTPVVRPIAPAASNFEEAEWEWLAAAANSHLAGKDPERDQDGDRPRTAPSHNGDKASSSS